MRVTRLTPEPAPEEADDSGDADGEAETADTASADPESADPESTEVAVAAPEAAASEPAPLPTGTPAEVAVQAVARILDSVGADVEVSLRADNDEFAGGPVIDINGPDSGLLIGRRGNTLQSLQFIVQSIVRQQFSEENVRVSLDVEQYRQRREDLLREMADRVAERVAQTGRSITLEPMSPPDRRVIHLYLDTREGVRTESVGYGEGRKVQIIPDGN